VTCRFDSPLFAVFALPQSWDKLKAYPERLSIVNRDAFASEILSGKK